MSGPVVKYIIPIALVADTAPDDIRAIRVRLGLTVAALARLVGVTERTAQRWVVGKREVPPPVTRLLALIEASGPDTPRLVPDGERIEAKLARARKLFGIED